MGVERKANMITAVIFAVIAAWLAYVLANRFLFA
jgi:hypothetical protein